ncbi:uncharacterized protein [Panulirus ornatus]|uniref:uncharacterized protein isoform X2 n=1 Tax=Panulirus ornatus TaxID=150431 RepID=UPI003A8ABFC3
MPNKKRRLVFMALLCMTVFEGVRDGFFVEAGAVDGEFLSNTLLLELRQGWTGLLVEPDGDMYRNLLQRHRKAWSSHSCLSPRPYAYREILIKYSANPDTEPGVSMYARGHGVLSSHEGVSPGMVVNGDSGVDQPLYEWVQCLPLASLLLALNTSHVHLVSLDVEGAETHILRSFPWHSITVDVWLVEHITAKATTPGDDRSRATHNHNATHANGDTVHHSSDNHATNTVTAAEGPRQRQRPDLQREGRDVEFVDFFSSKGYVLYPSDTASLLDNYLFIRRNSSVYKAEFDDVGQSRNAVLNR